MRKKAEEPATTRRCRVLVTDGEQRAALAVVRSLGKAGHEVFVCSALSKSVAGGSRFVRAEALVPDQLVMPVPYVDEVRRLIERWRIDVLVPITDAALQLLLPVRDSLGATIPFADIESYTALSDKQRVAIAAMELGIAAPRHVVVNGREDLLRAAETLDFPLVLKPTNSIRGDGGMLRKHEVAYADNRASLDALRVSLPATAFPLLAQERIVGPGTGVFLLIWNGELLASFAHQRIRERPPSGGETVYTKSIQVDPLLLEQCVALVRRFDWNGALMIEFKVDERTGVPYLMEVNARFWAGLQLAIDCSVDFPALLIDAAIGHPRRVSRFDVGRRVRWFWGDVDNLASRLRRSSADLHVPTERRRKLRAIAGFLKTTAHGERDAVFRQDDPKPFLRETRQWLNRVTRPLRPGASTPGTSNP